MTKPKRNLNLKNIKSGALAGATSTLNDAGYAVDPNKGWVYNLSSITSSSAIRLVFLFIGAAVVATPALGSNVASGNRRVAGVQINGNRGTVNINSDTLSEVSKAEPQQLGCEYTLCDNFCDSTKWTSHPNIHIISQCPLEISPIVDENQRGGTSYYRGLSLKPGFGTVINFKPCGAKQLNVSFKYGDFFEYRLGEGNYRSVKMFANGDYVAPKDHETSRYFNLSEPIRPCTSIKLQIDVLKPGGRYTSKAMVVRSSITYVGVSGIKHDDEAIPEFVVGTEDDVWKLQGLFGISVSDWQKTRDIRAVFDSIIIDGTRL